MQLAVMPEKEIVKCVGRESRWQWAREVGAVVLFVLGGVFVFFSALVGLWNWIVPFLRSQSGAATIDVGRILQFLILSFVALQFVFSMVPDMETEAVAFTSTVPILVTIVGFWWALPAGILIGIIMLGWQMIKGRQGR